MKKNILKRALTLALAALLALSLFACGKKNNDNSTSTSGATSYKVGICNYVDDASLNQIVDNIKTQLAAIGQEKGVTFEISYDNCNADSAVLNQIIANFIADKVDLMIGVATPVAVAMQAATEGTDIPVVYAAVSDPETAGLTAENVTGTSDALNTDFILDMMFAQNPDIQTVGLLYSLSEDNSKQPIEDAKAYLDAKGVKYVEGTGNTTDEIVAATNNMLDQVDAIFTPTDNRVMDAELTIAESLIEAGVPHYTGADSFVRNGAFATCGVNYTELGAYTADMVVDAMANGNLPAFHVMDGGIITVNTDTAEGLGADYSAFKTMAGEVVEVTTTED